MSEVGVAELARQVRDVLVRFQSLAERLDNTYLTKELFNLYKQLVDQTLNNIEKELEKLASAADVEELKKNKADKSEISTWTDRVKSKADQSDLNSIDKRVSGVEDNLKWAVRLVLGLVILAIVGVVVATGGKP